ncbi:hypothetical protein SCUP234_04102 [Seiridium cupressi]
MMQQTYKSSPPAHAYWSSCRINMALNFSSLPSEVQYSIFRLLDPIALVSFSQASRKYRSIISPTREHFVERILAIECLEEFGGPALQFRARDNAQSPNWEDEETINQMRWACTHCMRLLPHSNFDNHSLLRLGSRKPSPSSPAALPHTSWEPNGRIASKAMQESRRAVRLAGLKKLRRQYDVAVTLNWSHAGETQSAWDRLRDFQDAGLDAFKDMSTSEFKYLNSFKERHILDAAAESVERKICGYKRRLRKCNECRYQTGDLRSHKVMPPPGHGFTEYRAGANLGTEVVPIVRSRRLCIGTAIHRFFPGFLTNLPSHTKNAERAPTFTIYRQDARDKVFTTYMIRCPSCSSWKEMGAFRCSNHWPKWWLAYQHRWGESLWENWDGTVVDGAFIDALRCNSCYAAANGRDAFAKVVLEWYIENLVAELHRAQQYLARGWLLVWNTVDIERSAYVRPGDWYAPKQYHFNIRSDVLSNLPWKNPHNKRKGVTYITADEKTLQNLNQGHKILKEHLGTWHIRTEHDDNSPLSQWNDWFGSWMMGYDNLEAQWIWLRDCKKEILKRPEALVEWALGDKDAVNVNSLDIWGQATEKLSRKWSYDADDIKAL